MIVLYLLSLLKYEVNKVKEFIFLFTDLNHAGTQKRFIKYLLSCISDGTVVVYLFQYYILRTNIVYLAHTRHSIDI